MFSLLELKEREPKPNPTHHQCMMDIFAYNYMLLKYMNSSFLFRTVVFTCMLLLSEPLLIGGRFSHYSHDSVLHICQETAYTAQDSVLSLAKQVHNT